MLNVVFSFSALLSLVPAALLPYRQAREGPDRLFWIVLAVALVVPAAYSYSVLQSGWQTGLGITLWVSIAVSVAIFALLAAVTREAWRLSGILLPYLLLLAAMALVWGRAPEPATLSGPPDAALLLHIGVSVTTYGLCTLAAVAAAAVFLQERALKRKRSSRLTRGLPSILDSERLQVGLLSASEVILGVGILSGMVELYGREGEILSFSHKTLLSLLAFATIGLLLFVHHRSGLRGRRAARWVLIAYLLLTLAYPGVKFVTEVLLA